MDTNVISYADKLFCEVDKAIVNTDEYPFLLVNDSYYMFAEDYIKRFFGINAYHVYVTDEKLFILTKDTINNHTFDDTDNIEISVTEAGDINNCPIPMLKITIYLH